MQDETQHNEETVHAGEDTPEDSKYTHPSIIKVGPILVDASQRAVIVDGKTRRLTPVESKVLHFLAVHANTVCTFGQIESHVFFGYNGDGGATSIIKSKIRRIRSMIEPDPRNPIYILTVHDVGYTLVSHDLAEAMQKTSTDTDV